MSGFLEADPWASEVDKKSSNFLQTNNQSIFTANEEISNNKFYSDDPKTSGNFNMWNTHNVDELVSSNSSLHDSQPFRSTSFVKNDLFNAKIAEVKSGFADLTVSDTQFGTPIWENKNSDKTSFSNSISVQPHIGTNALDTSILNDSHELNYENQNDQNANSYGDDENEEMFDLWVASIRKSYNPSFFDNIKIQELPKREGLLFKHTNYLILHGSNDSNSSERSTVTHTAHDADQNAGPATKENTEEYSSSRGQVIRRYSDFVWLQSVLLKKYPFRMIPELPQKMIGSQNTDPVFLERRRLGLSRFTNLIMKHPVLKNDDLVTTFFTVPTDLSAWRKNAQYDTTEEFLDKKIEKSFIKMWKPKYAEYWNDLEENLDISLEYWTKITVLVDRFEKRQRAAAQERYLLKHALSKFSKECTNNLYPLDKQGSISDINSHMKHIENHLDKCIKLTLNENEEIKSSLSEKFKSFIEILFSMKGLFERYKILAGNNVLQLKRRVELNIEKLNSMKDNPDIKGATYDKLEANITEDKKTITDQINRSWLIKECILEEFVIFHETQFMITNLFQKWSQIYSKYSDLNSNEWDKLLTDLETMPTN